MGEFSAYPYTFNARSQLTATSGGTASFAYDGLGRRTSKVISGTTRRYLYDGSNIVQEKDQVGAVVANEIAGLGVDETYWRKEGSTHQNLLTDALGSTVAVTGSGRAVSTAFTYEPYGRATAGSSTSPFWFTGREWDGATGLQFNRARYYNPTWGRFVSEDPIGLAGGPNVYGYAGSAPTVFTDRLGLSPSDCGVLGWRCFSLSEIARIVLDVVALAASVAALWFFVHAAFAVAAEWALIGLTASISSALMALATRPPTFDTGLGVVGTVAGIVRPWGVVLSPYASLSSVALDIRNAVSEDEPFLS